MRRLPSWLGRNKKIVSLLAVGALGGGTAAVSCTCNVPIFGPPTATKLAFTAQPAGAVDGSAFTAQPVVAVEDSSGNPVTADSSTVTLAITSGTPATGGPGTLSNCSQAESSGVVTFTGCKLTTTGTGYQLHATDGSLTAANSTTFTVAASGGGGGSTTANIWVNTSAGASPSRSGSLVAYNSTHAYGSISAAVAASSPGDDVKIKTGSYGGQTIATNNSLRGLSPGCDPYGQWGSVSTTNCVTVEPESGGSVVINGNIEDHAASLWIKGATTGTITDPRARTFTITANGYVDTEADSDTVYPDHVTMEGINTLMLGTFSATDVYMRNIDSGPATVTGGDCHAVESLGGTFEDAIGLASGIGPVPSGIVWDGVFVHNQTRDLSGATDGDCHDGGLFLKCTTGFTLENSSFSQNAVYDVQEQANCGSGQPSNVTMQNNWFGCTVDWPYEESGAGATTCIGFADIQFNASGTFSNSLYRYNSFADGISCAGIACAFSNTRFIGNDGSVSSVDVCGKTGTTWAYNAWVGTSGGNRTCGGTDVSLSASNTLSLLFANATPGSEDLHLTNGTNVANNLVTPTTSDYTVTTDIDGDARTAGSRDAGSDER